MGRRHQPPKQSSLDDLPTTSPRAFLSPEHRLCLSRPQMPRPGAPWNITDLWGPSYLGNVSPGSAMKSSQEVNSGKENPPQNSLGQPDGSLGVPDAVCSGMAVGQRLNKGRSLEIPRVLVCISSNTHTHRLGPPRSQGLSLPLQGLARPLDSVFQAWVDCFCKKIPFSS